MAELDFVSSHLVSLWVETLLYGVFTVLYFICMYILLYRQSVERFALRTHLINIMVATLIYLLSTAHVSVNLARSIRAFLEEDDPEAFFAGFHDPIHWVKQLLYNMTVMCADTLLLYRCYIVWARNWKVVVLPAAVLAGGSAAGYMSVYSFSVADGGDASLYSGNIRKWATITYALWLIFNLSTTGLIAFRVWNHSRNMRSVFANTSTAKYNRVISMVIESGAIYCFALAIFLILYTTGTQGQRVVFDALAQIAGIMPVLIIVRIALGLNPSNTMDSSGVNSGRVEPGRPGHGGAHSLALQVRTETVHRTDGDNIVLKSSHGSSDGLHLSPVDKERAAL